MLSRAVWLNGTVGVGKTTVGESLAKHLAEAGDVVALINTDDLGAFWPRSADDPFNAGLVVENLGAVASNYVAAGARTIVISGVVQDRAQLEQYATALGTIPHVVRLVVPPEQIERRLHSRHGDSDPEGLRWHLSRAPELESILDRSDVPMTQIENHDHPMGTAQAVLAALGWPAVAPD